MPHYQLRQLLVPDIDLVSQHDMVPKQHDILPNVRAEHHHVLLPNADHARDAAGGADDRGGGGERGRGDDDDDDAGGGGGADGG
ncbi:MAG: hypothetical protein Q9227_006602 [Pyrenula ochraceoflavens]